MTMRPGASIRNDHGLISTAPSMTPTLSLREVPARDRLRKLFLTVSIRARIDLASRRRVAPSSVNAVKMNLHHIYEKLRLSGSAVSTIDALNEAQGEHRSLNSALQWSGSAGFHPSAMFFAALEPTILAWQAAPAALATGPHLIATSMVQLTVSFDYYRMITIE